MNTSFGPFGRSKLFTSSAGGRVVTSDGEQVYGFIQKGLDIDNVHQYLLQQCIRRSSERGNGVLSFVLKFDYLYDVINGQLASDGTMRCRIDGLRSIEAIIKSVMVCKDRIQNHFLKIEVWRKEFDIGKWIKDCCSSILVPACDLLTAQALISILSKWLLQTNTSITYSEVTSLSRCILQHTDLLLFSTLDGASVSSSVNPSSVNSYFLPASEVILLGNCYDLSALVRVVASPSSSTSSDADLKHLFKFVCIQHLLDDSLAYTLSTTSLSLAEGSSCSSSTLGSNPINGVLSTLLAYLTLLRVNVILTEDTVDEGTLHQLSSRGLYVIDRVSVSYLEYLSQRCHCRLFFTTMDCVDHCMDSALRTPPTGISTTNSSMCAYFAGLKRLKFIDGNYQQSDRRSSFLHITGLHYSSGEPVVNHAIERAAAEGVVSVAAAPQVVLRYLNLTQCGTCNRLIKRCLRAMQYSGDYDRDRRRNATEVTVRVDEVPVVVPGGGVAEMIWSRLWTQVADSLQSQSFTCHSSLNHEDEGESLPLFLANTIVSQFVGITSVDVRQRVFTQCVFLCRSLAEAYVCAPRQLLLSCIDLMDLPAECSSFSAGGNVRRRALTKFERMWSFWMDVVKSSPQGIIAITDNTSFDICTFGNMLEAGIVGTLAEFDSSFIELMESIRQLYRVGTDEAVKIRRKSVV